MDNQPYQPRFKVGDFVRYKGEVYEIDQIALSPKGPGYILKQHNSRVLTILNCEEKDPELSEVAW